MTDSNKLSQIANQLRIHSIESTTAAGSGHPTSCCSAAELISVLFFGTMRFDPRNPKAPNNDRFVLSKGHAAPILYAAWAEAGNFPVSDLKNLRRFDSPLEGHPTPELDFVDVATGSLGQGLSAGVGMAYHAKIDGLPFKTYVLMGDGETFEGSVWEAAAFAGIHKMNNLVAIIDVNRFGQSQETAYGWRLDAYRDRFESLGWQTEEIDGHDVSAIQRALAIRSDKPLVLIAKTIKGKGIPFAENKNGWHGKALKPEQANEVIALLRPKASSAAGVQIPRPAEVKPRRKEPKTAEKISYPPQEKVATRKAFGNALARLGAVNERIVVLDGDVENSTHTDEFAKKFPDRFVESYISEQNMIGMGTGLSAMGREPVASTFSAFFTRALDQIRMAGISRANLKLVGTHSGISIGEDGPSQMGLEDLAAMRAIIGSTVLCPSDAVSTERVMEKALEKDGIVYVRTARPETPILYSADEKFEIGGAKVLRQPKDSRATVIATGITVPEALEAADLLQKEGIPITVIDAYSIKPIARDLIKEAATKTDNRVITVEDHYPEGGLGDAVAGELSSQGVRVEKLAVCGLPRSGKKSELMSKYGIDAQAIIRVVKSQAARGGAKREAAA